MQRGKNEAFYACSYCRTLMENRMVEVERTGHCGPMTTASGRNGFDPENFSRCQYLENKDTAVVLY